MKRLSIAGFVVALSLVLSVSMFAKSKSQEVKLSHAAQVGTTTLQPGTYQVKVNDNNTVSFWQNGKQVVEVPSQSVQLATKSRFTSVTVDQSGTTPRISEIDFEGSQTAVGFPAQATATATGE